MEEREKPLFERVAYLEEVVAALLSYEQARAGEDGKRHRQYLLRKHMLALSPESLLGA